MHGLRANRQLSVDAFGLLVATIAIGGPLIFTRSGFALDFTNHLWAVNAQERAFASGHGPTYFLDAPANGSFYPFFMFYGGTAYAMTGGAAWLLGGHTIVAYTLSILLAVASAYGGLLWIARQLGVRGWPAHVPALTFTTSAYYVTNIYGRGAWSEHIAVSAFVLLLAAGLRLTRAPRIELVPAMLFVVSATVFTGTHTITLLLGGLVAVSTIAPARWVFGPNLVRRATLLPVAVLALLAVAINAWFFLPDVLHAGDTRIAESTIYAWSSTRPFNQFATVFHPLRHVPRQSTTPGLFVQIPFWLLAWAITTAVVTRRGAPPRLRRAYLALFAGLVILLCIVMIGPVYDAMPTTFRRIQSPYRLNSYVALVVAGLTLAGILTMQSVDASTARRVKHALAVAVAISIGLCMWQVYFATTLLPASYHNRGDAIAHAEEAPQSWYAKSDYADTSAKIIHGDLPRVTFASISVHSDTVTETITPPDGSEPFITNVVAGPYLMHLDTLVPVGRTPSGEMVVRRRTPGAGPLTVRLHASMTSITVGRSVSILALTLLMVLAVTRSLQSLRSAQHWEA